MKKFNKSLAITLILSLCLTLAAPVDAKSKVKLNITKATLSIGGSINLKLLNNKKKVTWKSSNKKVAFVTKKGKVKAKKKGKASIVARVGKKKYTCKVTVGSASKKSTKNVKKTAVPTATPEFGFGIGVKDNGNLHFYNKLSTFDARVFWLNQYSKKLVNNQVAWSISDESVAKLQMTNDPSQVIIVPQKSGEFDISVTTNGITKTKHITITFQEIRSSYKPF